MEIAGYTVSDAISLPPKVDYGIGVIGCGGIVNYAHLPAYRQAGFRVLACHDRDPEAAARTAREHGIPRVASSVDDLLSDPEIAIVDIAVTPWDQVAIAERAVGAGKHLLCQKPLADRYGDAVRLVRLASEASSWPSISRCAGTPGSPWPSNSSTRARSGCQQMPVSR